MAVVRITGDLQSSVAHAVSKQFDAAQKAAEATRPKIGQMVYDIVLEEFLRETVHLDGKYFKLCDEIEITLPDKQAHRQICQTWNLDGEYPIPYSLPKDKDVKWELSNYNFKPQITLRRGERFKGVFELVDAWQANLNKVVEDRNAAQAAVKKVLDSFTTLAPALKAWPALWDLLPEHTKDKHREIVSRTKAEPVKIDINETHLENLTSKLVVNRIMLKEKNNG
jgi:hypothetical protein